MSYICVCVYMYIEPAHMFYYNTHTGYMYVGYKRYMYSMCACIVHTIPQFNLNF